MMKKMQNHESALVRINEHNNGAKELISYTTRVLKLSSDGWLQVYGLYSATTRKHISWFMRGELGLSYQLAKQLYDDNIEYNINTGEFRKVE